MNYQTAVYLNNQTDLKLVPLLHTDRMDLSDIFLWNAHKVMSSKSHKFGLIIFVNSRVITK